MTNGNNNNHTLFITSIISTVQVGYHRTMQGHQRDCEKIAHNYLEWFSQNYTKLKNKYRMYCKLNGYVFDEDVFSDTYLKIYDTITRKGLKDPTPQGFDNYTFLSYKTNIKRENQYARVAHRDMNITSDNINDVYEDWYNSNKSSSEEKLKQDLFTDWATLYIMQVVEDNFPPEDFYLYRLKTLGNLTYKQIQDRTNEKRVRQRIMDIKNFLKENVRKEDVKELFHQRYNDIL